MKSGNTAVTKVNWDVGQVFDGNRLPKSADDGLRVIGSHLEDDVASCVARQRCQDLARNLFSELVGDDEVGSGICVLPGARSAGRSRGRGRGE